MTCVFCAIVADKAPSFRVWEDQSHLAFLSIFPNTQGVTVVVPKIHKPSYAFGLDPHDLTELTLAAQKVAHILDAKLPSVARTALVYEGFGVDHVHAKLFPMHGTRSESWAPIHSQERRFVETYEGFISTHDGHRAKDEDLEALAAYLRGEKSYHQDDSC